MLRINLLPAYIAERQKVRNAIIGSVILFLAVVGAMLGYQFLVLNKALEERTAEAEAKQQEADAEAAYEAKTASIRTQIKPLQEKVDFVEFTRYYNTLRPRIFRKAAEYTYRDVEYNQMSVSGNTLSINAYVKNIADVGRFYITFFGNPDVTAVSISGIPSWPAATGGTQGLLNVPGQPVPAYLRSFPVALNATLAKPISPPPLPASLQGGGAAGAGGAPGAPGGFAPTAPPIPSAPAGDEPGAAPDDTGV